MSLYAFIYFYSKVLIMKYGTYHLHVLHYVQFEIILLIIDFIYKISNSETDSLYFFDVSTQLFIRILQFIFFLYVY